MLGDKGYDSDWFRAALAERDSTPYIPPKSNRKVQYHYDKAIHKKRHRIENLFAKLKDSGASTPRYDRCAHTFMSAICIAGTVLFGLNQ
jgi:transposase